jgi:hypothetical protein
VVYVPRVDAITSTTFSYSSNSGYPYEQSGGTVNTITVTLDQNFIAPLDLTDQQVANSSATKFPNFARQQGGSLGKMMLQRIWSLLTTVNFGLSVAGLSIASFSRQSTVTILTTMSKRDVDTSKLSLITNMDVRNSLLQDSTIYQQYSSGFDVVGGAKIPSLARLSHFFDVRKVFSL